MHPLANDDAPYLRRDHNQGTFVKRKSVTANPWNQGSSMESKPPAAASDALERLFWTHGFVLSCEFSCTIFLVGVV